MFRSGQSSLSGLSFTQSQSMEDCEIDGRSEYARDGRCCGLSQMKVHMRNFRSYLVYLVVEVSGSADALRSHLGLSKFFSFDMVTCLPLLVPSIPTLSFFPIRPRTSSAGYFDDGVLRSMRLFRSSPRLYKFSQGIVKARPQTLAFALSIFSFCGQGVPFSSMKNTPCNLSAVRACNR